MNKIDIIQKLKNEYDVLDDEIKLALDAYSAYLITSDTYNYNHTSYALKCKFEEQSAGIGRDYKVSHNQFKYALYKNGYIPDDETDEYWCFKIAEQQKFIW